MIVIEFSFFKIYSINTFISTLKLFFNERREITTIKSASQVHLCSFNVVGLTPQTKIGKEKDRR